MLPSSKSEDNTAAEQAEQVASWLGLFIEPDQVTELRAVAVSTSSYRKPHTESAYFDGQHLEDMAEAALRLTEWSEGGTEQEYRASFEQEGRAT